jgi:hypothetical protein
MVFEIASPKAYTTSNFAEYNEQQTKSMDSVETAVKASKMLKGETIKSIAEKINEFDTLGELYADKKAVGKILDSFELAGIINSKSRPGYEEKDGSISEAGKNFIENTLLGGILKDDNLRRVNNPGIKNVRAKLFRAIVPLINNKTAGDYSINSELNEAVDILATALGDKNIGTVDNLVKQGAMFDAGYSKAGAELARRIEMNTQKGFAELMQRLDASMQVSANGEVDIFLGEVESKDEILGRLLEIRKAIQAVKKTFVEKIKGIFKARGAA